MFCSSYSVGNLSNKEVVTANGQRDCLIMNLVYKYKIIKLVVKVTFCLWSTLPYYKTGLNIKLNFFD